MSTLSISDAATSFSYLLVNLNTVTGKVFHEIRGDGIGSEFMQRYFVLRESQKSRC